MNITEEAIAVFSTHNGDRRTGSVTDLFSAAKNGDLADVWAPDAPTRFVALHFLIGLAQTAFAPVNHAHWVQVLNAGGFAGDEVSRRIEPFVAAFDLESAESLVNRFTPAGADIEAAAMALASLHICEPGAENVSNGNAFFQKSAGYTKLGPWFAFLALYGAQCVHPPVGGGYYNIPAGATSLRALLVGRTLFETIWLNVLPQSDEVMLRGKFPPVADWTLFPWLHSAVPDLPKDRGKAGTLQVNVGELHPTATYWSAGRRYVLLKDDADGICDLTGLSGPTYSRVARWPAGLLFTAGKEEFSAAEAGWQHPLTLRERLTRPDGDSTALKAHYYPGLRAPLRLDDWARFYLVADNSEEPKSGGRQIIPPPVLRDFVLLKRPEANDAGLGLEHVRLEVCGYFTSGKVVHGWTQRSLPTDIFPDRDSAQAFSAEVLKALLAAQAAVYRLLQSVKSAGFGESPADLFWNAIEGEFITFLVTTKAALLSDADNEVLNEAISLAHSAWTKAMRRHAISIFDAGIRHTPPQAINKSIANARRDLMAHFFRKKTDNNNHQSEAA